MPSPPPPAPPPAPPPLILPITTKAIPPPILPPISTSTKPYLLSLLIYYGSPFADHWAYFVSSEQNKTLGVEIHAIGDVRSGFEFQIKRSFDIQGENGEGENVPTKRIPLGWVGGEWFSDTYRREGEEEGGGDEERMLSGGVLKLDDTPVCAFERVLKGVEVPGKSLVSGDDAASGGGGGGGGGSGEDASASASGHTRPKKIVQRNCQTWIIESAAQLVKEGILDEQVLEYLRAIEQ